LPPSSLKNPSEKKVFLDLWKRARKMLIDCDILRVIGSSLSDHDIALLSLLLCSLSKSKEQFTVELIIPEKEALGNDKTQTPGIIQRLHFIRKPVNLSALDIFEKGDIPESITNPYHYWIDKKVRQIEKNTGKDADKFILDRIGGN
jgi:hypothetical protein